VHEDPKVQKVQRELQKEHEGLKVQTVLVQMEHEGQKEQMVQKGLRQMVHEDQMGQMGWKVLRMGLEGPKVLMVLVQMEHEGHRALRKFEQPQVELSSVRAEAHRKLQSNLPFQQSMPDTRHWYDRF